MQENNTGCFFSEHMGVEVFPRGMRAVHII